jgi:hypothetical protein
MRSASVDSLPFLFYGSESIFFILELACSHWPLLAANSISRQHEHVIGRRVGLGWENWIRAAIGRRQWSNSLAERNDGISGARRR